MCWGLLGLSGSSAAQAACLLCLGLLPAGMGPARAVLPGPQAAHVPAARLPSACSPCRPAQGRLVQLYCTAVQGVLGKAPPPAQHKGHAAQPCLPCQWSQASDQTRHSTGQHRPSHRQPRQGPGSVGQVLGSSG